MCSFSYAITVEWIQVRLAGVKRVDSMFHQLPSVDPTKGMKRWGASLPWPTQSRAALLLCGRRQRPPWSGLDRHGSAQLLPTRLHEVWDKFRIERGVEVPWVIDRRKYLQISGGG